MGNGAGSRPWRPVDCLGERTGEVEEEVAHGPVNR
jgi:hypothetical protein